MGVTIAASQEEYRKALEESFAYEPQAVVREFIQGREFSVAVIGQKAYPIIEIAPKEGFYDYKNKYTAGKYGGDLPGGAAGGEKQRKCRKPPCGLRRLWESAGTAAWIFSCVRTQALLSGGQHPSGQ